MKSLLFVPAIKKMINKIPQFTADAFIIDLEDSIPDGHKDEALENVCSFLKNEHDNVFIRLDGKHLKEEIAVLKDFSFSGYMIPKFETPSNYEEFHEELKIRFVIALIETPLAMVNIQEIANCEWVDGLAFGAEDYTAAVGMVNKQDYLISIRNQLLMYGKAYRKPVYDSPSFIIDDEESLTNEIRHAQEMGFDGKLAINPRQIPIVNRIFRSCDMDYIKYVIEQYEASDSAVVKIDGKVYERMHISHLRKILDENTKRGE